ncbi:serine/threonine-protein kinase [Nocardia sp. alder85J]|uniref:serine/threonine-protein kinase n=1 Tax=Nocardia sp. alder85J TaxID=2862949 RepID=UPI001CD38A8B|nr:serine/threonine-protein kinase [Nocardia sp. alder85J]MCX4097282.1 protein kinase [Nocardia sp. alder85J]
MATRQFGDYRLERLIGRGSAGEVWLARDAEDRAVALKILSVTAAEDQDYRRRFEREARIGARLSNPHVVPIRAFGEHQGRLFLAMTHIPGIDLSARLHVGPLGAPEAADLVSQVAEALDAAHAAGLIHRDVKPANIIVHASGFAYLIDFGIARASDQTTITATGFTVGTLAYMAPERFTGHAEARSDIYALTCVLYECLTAQRPFGDTDPARQLHSHLHQQPPAVHTLDPALPAALDEVIARGMAKKPEDRYPTAGALATAALTAVGLTRPVPRTPPDLDRAAAPRNRPATTRPPTGDLRLSAPDRPTPTSGPAASPSGPPGPRSQPVQHSPGVAPRPHNSTPPADHGREAQPVGPAPQSVGSEVRPPRGSTPQPGEPPSGALPGPHGSPSSGQPGLAPPWGQHGSVPSRQSGAGMPPGPYGTGPVRPNGMASGQPDRGAPPRQPGPADPAAVRSPRGGPVVAGRPQTGPLPTQVLPASDPALLAVRTGPTHATSDEVRPARRSIKVAAVGLGALVLTLALIAVVTALVSSTGGHGQSSTTAPDSPASVPVTSPAASPATIPPTTAPRPFPLPSPLQIPIPPGFPTQFHIPGRAAPTHGSDSPDNQGN